MKIYDDIEQVRAMVKKAYGLDVNEYDEIIDNEGIIGLVDVDDMGFTDNGKTRWYTFKDFDGNPCIFYKYGKMPEYWNSDETY